MAKAAASGRRGAERARDRLAAEARGAGVRVEETADGLRLTGRDLRAEVWRWTR